MLLSRLQTSFGFQNDDGEAIAMLPRYTEYGVTTIKSHQERYLGGGHSALATDRQ